MDPRAPDTPRRWTRVLPALLVALVGAVGGAWFATRTEVPEPLADGADPAAAVTGGTALAEGDAEDAALVALQASLLRSQVLPSDFRTVPPFELQGTDGEPLTEAMLEGRWSLLFFGFTHCPDVCPLTLSVMKDVVDELETGPLEPMQVVFVTVDPVRDTAERLAEYVAFFDERFVGVTGELGAIHDLTRALGIVAAFTANDEDPEAYTVDHTASMLLVDPERRVRAKLTAPHEVDTIVADYRAIRSALN